MKAASLSLLALASIFAGCATAPPIAHKGEHMLVRTTAYTPNEKGGGGYCNACGQRLHFGGDTYSAAADWAWLPLGTRFRMAETGRTYVIEDYGSALVGKKTIDLYMPTRADMRSWGARNVNIEILEWGSPVMSLRLLVPRQKAGYVRTMVAGLRRQHHPGEAASTLIARNETERN
jgi:3D (Asp-Asp-Asp) domain-containing protein